MSHRLQVLIPEELETTLCKAAARKGVSKGEWVRRAIESSLRAEASETGPDVDPLERLAALAGPTADVEQMLAEIEKGRA